MPRQPRGTRKRHKLPKPPNPTSVIPEEFEKPVDKDLRVDLLSMVVLLLKYLTPVLCETVFKKHQTKERERKWAFYDVCMFWVAMIVRHPSGIQAGVSETRKRGRVRDKLWPRVRTSARAFHTKATGLGYHLFQAVYDAFTARILPQTSGAYASWLGQLRKDFPEIIIVDGSRLDAVCRKIGILRKVTAKVLPGCVTVFYDLFRGISRQVLFFPDAAEGEFPRGLPGLTWIAKGALLMGDRLYSSVQYFLLLADLNLYGLFRKNGTLKIRVLEVISRKQIKGTRCFLEDARVEVGCGVGQPTVTLRLTQFRSPRGILELLTNVLDPQKLAPETAVALYGMRWTIERMFLDLKETLDLRTLHSSHPNLVAQQIYAAAIVHTAFRIAQARIAKKAKVRPEQISPAKLFPKLAQAADDYCVAHIYVMRLQELNPGINVPGLGVLSSAYTSLGSILVEHRNPHRRRRRFCAGRKTWKSFAHVPGGPTFLKSLSVV